MTRFHSFQHIFSVLYIKQLIKKICGFVRKLFWFLSGGRIVFKGSILEVGVVRVNYVKKV